MQGKVGHNALLMDDKENHPTKRAILDRPTANSHTNGAKIIERGHLTQAKLGVEKGASLAPLIAPSSWAAVDTNFALLFLNPYHFGHGLTQDG